MNKKKSLLNLINKRLEDDRVCFEYEIPLDDKISKRFAYVKYLILEIWDKDEVQNNLIDIFGLARWKEIYLLLIKGI